MVVISVFWLGWAMLRSGLRRSKRRRVEAKEAAAAAEARRVEEQKRLQDEFATREQALTEERRRREEAEALRGRPAGHRRPRDGGRRCPPPTATRADRLDDRRDGSDPASTTRATDATPTGADRVDDPGSRLDDRVAARRPRAPGPARRPARSDPAAGPPLTAVRRRPRPARARADTTRRQATPPRRPVPPDDHGDHHRTVGSTRTHRVSAAAVGRGDRRADAAVDVAHRARAGRPRRAPPGPPRPGPGGRRARRRRRRAPR